jgi:zeaxanthin glucosyltransferase
VGAEALLIDQTSFAGPTIAEQLDLPFVSVCCALMLNHDPAVPPLNTGLAYSPSRRARLRNELGHELVARLAAPITRVTVDHRAQEGLRRSRQPAAGSLSQGAAERPAADLGLPRHDPAPPARPVRDHRGGLQ